jgi:hypothetical protein
MGLGQTGREPYRLEQNIPDTPNLADMLIGNAPDFLKPLIQQVASQFGKVGAEIFRRVGLDIKYCCKGRTSPRLSTRMKYRSIRSTIGSCHPYFSRSRA